MDYNTIQYNMSEHKNYTIYFYFFFDSFQFYVFINVNNKYKFSWKTLICN